MTRRRTAALPKRTPSGQLSRSVERLVEAHSPTQVRRLRDAALRNMAAPEWGSELGRLFLETKLEAQQFEAGRRFSALAQEYHSVVGAPGFPTASAGQNGKSGREEGPLEAERYLQVVSAYGDARAVLQAANCEAIVRLCCERDASVSTTDALRKLTYGLDALASHWGIPS